LTTSNGKQKKSSALAPLRPFSAESKIRGSKLMAASMHDLHGTAKFLMKKIRKTKN
jgi:hypothetical protein